MMNEKIKYARKAERERVEAESFTHRVYLVEDSRKAICKKLLMNAEHNFHKALEPNSPTLQGGKKTRSWVHAHLGATQYRLAWLVDETYNKLCESRENFKAALGLRDKYAWAYAHRGESYLALALLKCRNSSLEGPSAEEYFKSSIHSFRSAIVYDRDYGWAHAHMGAAFRARSLTSARENDDPKSAIAAFNNALEIDPDYMWAKSYKVTMQRFVASIAREDRQFELSANWFAKAFYELGDVMTQQPDIFAEMSILDVTGPDEEDDLLSMYNNAMNLLRGGKMDKAVKEIRKFYKKASELMPFNLESKGGVSNE